MSSAQNPSTFEKRIAAMLRGFGQEFPPSAQQVIFGGKTMTLAEVHEQLRQIVDTLENVHRTEEVYHRAVVARRAAMAAARAFYEDGVLFVRHHFGRESKRAISFGIPALRPRRALSIQEKAIAKAKAAATRVLRGTRGPKQRAAISVDVQPTLQVLGADGKLLPGQEASSPSSSTAGTAPGSDEPNPGGAE
jgi:hypothetical protein